MVGWDENQEKNSPHFNIIMEKNDCSGHFNNMLPASGSEFKLNRVSLQGSRNSKILSKHRHEWVNVHRRMGRKAK